MCRRELLSPSLAPPPVARRGDNLSASMCTGLEESADSRKGEGGFHRFHALVVVMVVAMVVVMFVVTVVVMVANLNSFALRISPLPPSASSTSWISLPVLDPFSSIRLRELANL